jgi:hypothetical protein
MQCTIHRSIPVTGDTTIRSLGTRLRKFAEVNNSRKALCGEWPATSGLEDKQALSALNVQLDRNSGLPKGRKAQGNGVSIVLGERESRLHGEGGQVLQRVKDERKSRDARNELNPGTHS